MENQTTSALPSTPPSPPVKMSVMGSSGIKSSLLVIMSICLLIATGLAGLFYFQIQKLSKKLAQYQAQPSSTSLVSPEPSAEVGTANWKTYTNKKYNFSIKYPNFYQENTTLQSPNNPGLDLVGFKNPESNATFHIYYNQSQFTLDFLKKYAPTGSENITPTQRIFGQNTFYYYGAGGGGVNYDDRFFYNLNDKILILDFNGPYGDNGNLPSKQVQLFESQILPTFKFLETTSQNDKDLTKEECAQQKGVWQQWGKLNQEYCQIPAPDAGKSCTDGSQCSMKSCVAVNNKIPGECQTYKAIFGCNKFITNGNIDSKTLCAD